LRGVIDSGSSPLPLRQRVRDRILASNSPLWDEFTIEALALLGPDLDERALVFLMRLVPTAGTSSKRSWSGQGRP
jgi:hypothetical protein